MPDYHRQSIEDYPFQAIDEQHAMTLFERLRALHASSARSRQAGMSEGASTLFNSCTYKSTEAETVTFAAGSMFNIFICTVVHVDRLPADAQHVVDQAIMNVYTVNYLLEAPERFMYGVIRTNAIGHRAYSLPDKVALSQAENDTYNLTVADLEMMHDIDILQLLKLVS